MLSRVLGFRFADILRKFNYVQGRECNAETMFVSGPVLDPRLVGTAVLVRYSCVHTTY